ncbi:MAG: dephospho-CoA kinase [Hellea sp.]|nr:dephospho-CoA kinase [Hellea sp.]
MIVLGLTGSIGMGKTTTTQMFRDAGCPVFDADAAVHSLYAKGGAAVPIIKAVFPDAIKDQAIDREILGKHMRADPLQLKVLESFIHPLVAAKRQDFMEKAGAAKSDIIVMDVPLLFETGEDRYVDKIVVVTASAEVQRKRVMARPGMTESLFEMLLTRQTPDVEKRAKADYLIFTDQGLEAARSQVNNILLELRK